MMCVPKSLRIVQFASPMERLFWTIRLLRWEDTFPESYHEMCWSDEPTQEEYHRTLRTWQFLAPFFASRGYNPHTKDTKSDDLLPVSNPQHPEHNAYPFARFIPSSYINFSWFSSSMWAARDKLGRDVVIKVISDVSNPSHELRVMQRLNPKELRSDPYNHTIPVLDFLTFDNLVFVVMPRWDGAFAADFEIVAELMEITKTFLETFVFLHKNKLVHLDFLCQNTGMNVILDSRELWSKKGLRNPGEVKYVLFDFGNSIAFPEDTVIENVTATRRLNYGLRRLPKVEGPFKADVAFLGSELQIMVRHIENIVPELGPFFEQIIIMMDDKQFTAPQALSRFLEIYSSLTPEQLQAPVLTESWSKGKVRYKKQTSAVSEV